MFILVRKETPLPDGGTQVDESRQYFNKDAVLIRELRKSGRFKPGESTDTQHVPNVVEADGDTAVGDHEKKCPNARCYHTNKPSASTTAWRRCKTRNTC